MERWYEEVKKGRESVVDWTLKRRDGVRKSKRNKEIRRIGRRSRGKAQGSPKGKMKRDGLDIEAEGRHEEVQKGRERETDWTLKQREGTRKSKRDEKAWQIGL